MDTDYRIGCSGYYYPNWKNKFYPTGMQPKDWLKYYSSVFNTVELNGTFYRIPKLSDLKKYALVTGDDFKFSVKMSRYISHVIRLKESKQLIADFQNTILEGLEKKLNYFLFQLPPSFSYNEENLEKIILNIPHVPENIIEFRHISWWNKEVERIFTKAKISFCNIDYPGLKTNFIHTSDVFYLRLHGNPDLFKSSYSRSELENFYKKIPEDTRHHSIYFNNTYYDAGYKNALELMEIIKK
jgi:uncharacterized protein YecE (DUF72 family)